MKRVALYARTSLGTERGQTPETQLLALRVWADRLGVEIVAEYVDQVSGARADRAGLRALRHFRSAVPARSRHWPLLVQDHEVPEG